MEGIKDFIEDVKSRFANPFISSFIIAWFFWNWKIPMTLIFYNQDQLYIDGYKSYIDVVLENSTPINYFGVPLIIAFLYVFVFPHFKAFIRLTHAKISSKNDDDILEATKEGVMPVKKYIKLKKDNEVLNLELTKLVQNESDVVNQNESYKVVIQELKDKTKVDKNSIHNFQNKLNLYKSFNSITLLEGKWDVVIQKSSNETSSKFWHFTSRHVDIGGREYKVQTIIGDPETGQIFLILNDESVGSVLLRMYHFTINKACNIIEGYNVNDKKIPIKMKKIRQ
ncbi:MAG: hypothetical protein WBP45_06760 [Daejeonella sp.]